MPGGPSCTPLSKLSETTSFDELHATTATPNESKARDLISPETSARPRPSSAQQFQPVMRPIVIDAALPRASMSEPPRLSGGGLRPPRLIRRAGSAPGSRRVGERARRASVALGLEDQQPVVLIPGLTAGVDDLGQEPVGRRLVGDDHQLGLELLSGQLGHPLLALGVLLEDVDERRDVVAVLAVALHGRIDAPLVDGGDAVALDQ